MGKFTCEYPDSGARFLTRPVTPLSPSHSLLRAAVAIADIFLGSEAALQFIPPDDA